MPVILFTVIFPIFLRIICCDCACSAIRWWDTDTNSIVETPYKVIFCTPLADNCDCCCLCCYNCFCTSGCFCLTPLVLISAGLLTGFFLVRYNFSLFQ